MMVKKPDKIREILTGSIVTFPIPVRFPGNLLP